MSLLPLAAFILGSYAGIQWIRVCPRIAFVPVLTLTLGVFVAMKRYAFVPASLWLPPTFATIGLSYILFRVLHLMVDTRAGAIENRIGLFSYLQYTANFATLASGPIQLYPDFERTSQSAMKFRLSAATAALAFERIVRGLFKTNVLALLFSVFHTRLIDSLTVTQPNALFAALALCCYPLFLFCNFSGYIDIVIAAGQLLGLQFPENFVRPFSSGNFLDFWTFGWHITLSSWLRNYVYNPLLIGLMRAFPSRALELVFAVFAYFVTFFLVGAWHGPTREFLFYGLLLGLGVSLNKAYQLAMAAWIGRKRFAAISSKPFYLAWSRGLTFAFYAGSLTWFWSSWHQIAAIRQVLGGWTIAASFLLVFCGSTILLAIVNAMRERRTDPDPSLDSAWRVLRTTAMLVAIAVMSLFATESAPEIVYKAF